MLQSTSSHIVNFSLTRWMWSGQEFSLCGPEVIETLWGLGAALGVVTFFEKVENWAALQDVRLGWTCDPWWFSQCYWWASDSPQDGFPESGVRQIGCVAFLPAGSQLPSSPWGARGGSRNSIQVQPSCWLFLTFASQKRVFGFFPFSGYVYVFFPSRL